MDSKSENNLFVACCVVQLEPTDFPNATRAQLVILCNNNNNSLLDYYYCVVLIPVIIGFCILEFCVAYDWQKCPNVRASLQFQWDHLLQNYPPQVVQQKGDYCCCFSVFLSFACYRFVDNMWWWCVDSKPAQIDHLLLKVCDRGGSCLLCQMSGDSQNSSLGFRVC